jgi:Mg-chelatase subunit ChlD
MFTALPSPMAWIARVAVVPLLLLVASPAHPQEIVSPLQEQARVRLRLVRLRINPTTAADPGECLALGPSDLKVTVGRERVAENRVALEREKEPTLHALLVDSSKSMKSWMDECRRAVNAYLEQLDPDLDRSLLVTFNASVLLETGAHADNDRIREVMKTLQLGDSTLLNDALYHMIRELSGHRDRSVLLLLTDGTDTGSVHQEQDVLDLLAKRPGVTVFSIGLGTGVTSAHAGYLRKLAELSRGKFFPIPGGVTARRLETILLEIRELLEHEATLIVVDPKPDGPPRRVRVSSRSLECDAHVLAELGSPDEHREPAPVLDEDAPRILLAPSVRSFGERLLRDTAPARDGPCEAVQTSGASLPEWFVEVQPDLLRGCVLDVALESGLLYSETEPGFLKVNQWIDLRTRMIEVAVPPLDELPRSPEDLLSAVARHIAESSSQPRLDPLNRKGHHHARRYDDLPSLVNGVTFLELRPVLAAALFQYPRYRQWALARLREAADRELAALEKEFRALAPPEMLPEELRALVDGSPEGREIVRWAETPTAVDLTDHLAAWLGDVSAHDLLVRWEVRQIEDRIDDPSFDRERPADEWQRLRSVLGLPSRARVLTLLSPVFDEATDRIGFFRVVLPRPSWMGPRVAGWGEKSGFGPPPLDLIPAQPLALWSFEAALSDHPGLDRRLRDGGYRVASISYELLGKARSHLPHNAFGNTSVVINLEPEAPGAAVRVTAEVLLDSEKAEPRLRSLVVEEPTWTSDGRSGRTAESPQR